MAINTFVVKKWAALILAGVIPTMCFFIGLNFYSFLMAIILFLVGLVVGVIVSSVLLKNPFSAMVEGKGLLTLNIDSTGVIRPFIVGLNQPYVKGRLLNDSVNDVYDREAVLSLAPPTKAGKAITSQNRKVKTKKGGLDLSLSEEDFNKSRFGLYHYPVLIYNAQLKSMLTKDFLSGQEKQAFAEHGVLYLNRKMEELTSIIRDFGRYVVELTKPKASIFQNKWFLIVLVVGLIAMLVLFGKPLINSIMSIGGNAVGGLGSAAVIPK